MLISSNETKLIKESEADEEQREKKERKIRREKKSGKNAADWPMT